MTVPNHPERDDAEGPDHPASARRTALIIAGVLVLVVVIALHVAGVFGP